MKYNTKWIIFWMCLLLGTIFALMIPLGCIPEDAIKANIGSDETAQTSGQQEVGLGMNIGNLILDIQGTWWAVLGLIIIILFLIKQRSKAIKTVDILVKKLDELNISKPDKNEIRGMALSRKVEGLLNKRVRKTRKREIRISK